MIILLSLFIQQTNKLLNTCCVPGTVKALLTSGQQANILVHVELGFDFGIPEWNSVCQISCCASVYGILMNVNFSFKYATGIKWN